MRESTSMENSPKGHHALEETLCRRRAGRITLPVEVELWNGNLTIMAVIRDVSFSEEENSSIIGIGLFHNDELPLDETINCRTVSHSELLPVESTISLLWTRHFGNDGFLSGGRMSANAAMSDQDTERRTHPGKFDEQRMD